MFVLGQDSDYWDEERGEQQARGVEQDRSFEHICLKASLVKRDFDFGKTTVILRKIFNLFP